MKKAFPARCGVGCGAGHGVSPAGRRRSPSTRPTSSTTAPVPRATAACARRSTRRTPLSDTDTINFNIGVAGRRGSESPTCCVPVPGDHRRHDPAGLCGQADRGARRKPEPQTLDWRSASRAAAAPSAASSSTASTRRVSPWDERIPGAHPGAERQLPHRGQLHRDRRDRSARPRNRNEGIFVHHGVRRQRAEHHRPQRDLGQRPQRNHDRRGRGRKRHPGEPHRDERLRNGRARECSTGGSGSSAPARQPDRRDGRRRGQRHLRERRRMGS